MKDSLSDHQVVLSTICIASILLGLPLSNNMLWHLQVANNNSGRGVLRLIQLHTYINLLCVPMLCADLVILAFPSTKMPSLMCGCLEWAVTFTWVNSSFKGFTIALGR